MEQSVCSDSESSSISQTSLVGQPMAPHQKFDDEVLNTAFTRPQITDNSIEYGEQARQFNRPIKSILHFSGNLVEKLFQPAPGCVKYFLSKWTTSNNSYYVE